MRNQDLTSSPVGKKLFALSLPMFIGVIAFGSIDLIDLIFIARLGDQAVSAVGFCVPLMGFGGVLIGGLGTAVNSIVSRAYGASDDGKLRSSTLHGILLGSVGAFLFALIGLIYTEPLLSALGASSRLIDLAQRYLWIWFVGFPLAFLPATCGSALAGIGDTRTPMLLFVMAAVINLVLDPIFIFGFGPVPALGLQGAALASTFAKGFVGMVVLGIVLQHQVIAPRLRDFFTDARSTNWELMRLSLPVISGGVIHPLSVAAYTYALAGFGEGAIAAVTVGARIRDFVGQVPNGLGMGLAPLVGQNWGAGLRQRVLMAVALTEKICLGWGVMVWVVFAIGGQYIATVFVTGEESTQVLQLYLLISMSVVGPRGVSSMGLKAFNAIGDSRQTLKFSVSSSAIIIVLVLIVPQSWGIAALFGVVAAPSFVFAALIPLYFRRMVGAPSPEEHALDLARKERTKEVFL